MSNLLWLQVRALVWKNWIVLSKHRITAILRCLILPIGYSFFIGYGQVFFHRLNNYGMGSPTSILPMNRQFDGQGAFLWADETDGTYNPAPADIIARVTSDFTPDQLKNVKKLDSLDAIRASCPQNLNGVSPCFAGIGFTDRFNDTSVPTTFFTITNYTIFADSGLSYIDAPNHDSDVEQRILPLQWALDKAIIELRTGLEQQTPLEWPYTNATNHDQKVRIRLSYIRGIREIISLALFLGFVGISYQIPGSTVNERALLITTHMKVMGLLDSARTLSWHLSVCITYLPAWIVVALVWKYLIFLNTSTVLLVVLHLLLGLVLASWSFLTAAPFSSSPQLAAITSALLAIIAALLGLVVDITKIAPMLVFTLFLPPSFYIYALKAICGFENQQMPVDVLKGDPDNGIVLLPLICIAVINIFLWPFLAVLLERYLHDAQTLIPRRKSKVLQEENYPSRSNTAISIRNLSKIYKSSVPGSKRCVSAVEDLSLDIPMSGIFVLLGSNGAGKSTTLSVIAGLTSMTSGAIMFDGENGRPRRGLLGIVPQKNVLLPELTCLQTLQVWKSVKLSENSKEDEDLELLLRDCDLGHKIHAIAGTLSGGQKRKLQLAIGLLGGSKVILVDECTSGVDPLSRRALWRTLLQYREDRAIVFTTHFLDEADLLADQIAILTSPGKVVASGSPVELKRKYGRGYSIQVSFEEGLELDEVCKGRQRIMEKIHDISPLAHSTTTSSRLESYHLNTKDSALVDEALQVAEQEKKSGLVFSYDLFGTTIEDVFLAVVNDCQAPEEEIQSEQGSYVAQATHPAYQSDATSTVALDLPAGRHVSSFHQACTIFYKRALILKRNWPTPVLALLVAVVGCCIPLTFLYGRHQSCAPQLRDEFPPSRLYLPSSPLLISLDLLDAVTGPPKLLYASPPGIVSTLGPSTDSLDIRNVADNATFVSTIYKDFHDISIGGVSVNLTTGESLVAWEASPPGLRALSTLNMASNILINRALNSTQNTGPLPTLIQAQYVTFKKVVESTLVYMKWTFFFGAIMALYPAFSALYVVKERCSSVQAMQFSNGLTNPFGLWLGHLMFDTIFSTLLATIVIVVFALVSSHFHGLGIFWLILVLYGITGHLFAYCLSHLASSPLGAFALVACYQIVAFMIYITAYMAIFTFGPIGSSTRLMTIVHFSTSFISPVTSVTRAALVSVNLFSLACDGTNYASGESLVSLTKLGGPILYLVMYILGLSAVLFWIGSGSISDLFRTDPGMRKKRHFDIFPFSDKKMAEDCGQPSSCTNLLQVAGLSKTFNKNKVIDNVDINVQKDSTFALLGPNGAGKTTTFNIIRGDILADAGDVLINGYSIVKHRASARSSLGVCPQFTAIDPQLTVREHLVVYGRLKGLEWGQELDRSVEAVLQGTSLSVYAERMANRLSGGNQRKLSLAIALLGNPAVLLIDEFSSGVDPKMKREMWGTLRNVSKDKAIIITTHSMEEASALASHVGIMAKRILALGSPESLAKRHGMYEVHFRCPTPEDVLKARSLMSHVPGASMINDVATRFEVPVVQDSDIPSKEPNIDPCGVVSLASLYAILSSNDHGSMEYTVEKASLESVFLKVIREHNIKEQEMSTRTVSSTRWWERFC